MLGIVSEDENHNKIFKPMAGATLGQGVPLGTWCSFEKDVAPSDNWLMAGTTFDATKYPALNLYLGTNKVPYRYDHNRPSEWEDITLSTDSNNPTVMQNDADIIFSVRDGSGQTTNIYISQDNGATWKTILANRCNIDPSNTATTINLNKGDKIYYTPSSGITVTSYIRYYTHPLFIKATSIASDSDQQSILAQIQAYNTYSTEETLTGKTVIVNGVRKPVYRKYTQFMKDGSYINDCSITNDQLSGVMPTDYDFIVTYELTCRATESSNYFWDIMTGSRTYNKRINIYETNNVKATTVYVNTGYIIYDGWFYIEYTKTTD